MNDVAEGFDSGGWKFTEEVVDVFDEHVSHNVPHYEVMQSIVAHLSDWFAPQDALIADIGASTGTTADLIEKRHQSRGLRYALYDIEQPMLNAAKTKLVQTPDQQARFSFHHQDAAETALAHKDADMTLALFTLQFLQPHRRVAALSWARAAARPSNGVLVVAEKVMQPTAEWQEIANEATWDFKATKGVSPETIRAKARALRGVLVPRSMEQIKAEMVEAGWSEPTVVWQFYQWAVVVAHADATIDPYQRLTSAEHGKDKPRERRT